jgi:hypothetical protein
MDSVKALLVFFALTGCAEVASELPLRRAMSASTGAPAARLSDASRLGPPEPRGLSARHQSLPTTTTAKVTIYWWRPPVEVELSRNQSGKAAVGGGPRVGESSFAGGGGFGAGGFDAVSERFAGGGDGSIEDAVFRARAPICAGTVAGALTDRVDAACCAVSTPGGGAREAGGAGTSIADEALGENAAGGVASCVAASDGGWSAGAGFVAGRSTTFAIWWRARQSAMQAIARPKPMTSDT